jgi:hypothetical protein
VGSSPGSTRFSVPKNAGNVNAWLTVPGNAGKSLLEHFVEVGAVGVPDVAGIDRNSISTNGLI